MYTVTSPATAPMANVMLDGMVCPGRALPCTNCFSVVYVVKRTAEFAPWRIIYHRESALNSRNKELCKTYDREQPAINAEDTFTPDDADGAVQQPAVLRVRPVCVVYELRSGLGVTSGDECTLYGRINALYGLRGCDGKDGLHHACAEAG